MSVNFGPDPCESISIFHFFTFPQHLDLQKLETLQLYLGLEQYDFYPQ